MISVKSVRYPSKYDSIFSMISLNLSGLDSYKLISFLNCEADISDDLSGKQIRRIPKSELIAEIHPI